MYKPKLEYAKQVIELYNKGLTDKEIGEITGRKATAIFSFRSRRGLSVNKEYRNITPDELQIYIDEGLSDAEIGEKFNVHRNSVLSFRKSRGWGKPIKIDKKNFPIELTQEEKEILVGTMLGDGHLKEIKGSYKGKIEHCKVQKEYCYWKFEKLERISINFKEYSRERTIGKYSRGGTTHSCFFTFRANPALKYFYDLFYKNKIKYVNSEILQYLSPLAIAVWFMDDGQNSKSRKYKSNCIQFCTDSFLKEEVEILISFLKDKYGIESHYNSRGRIYIKASTKDLFLKLIEPYIHPSMWYKYTGENKAEFLENYNKNNLQNTL